MSKFEWNKKSIIESKPALFLLGVVIIVLAWTVLRFWSKMVETRKNLEIAAAKTSALEGQKIVLESDIAKLQTDRGKEEFFRENYGLAKAGEEIIIIVEDKSVPSETKQSAFGGFFSFFQNLFK